jgi:hypothetical protein
MTDIYIKKSLYPVNRLDFRLWLLFGRADLQEFTNQEIARTGSSLRSFRDIANDAVRRLEYASISGLRGF